jgi:hypothetical protein
MYQEVQSQDKEILDQKMNIVAMVTNIYVIYELKGVWLMNNIHC